MLTRALYLSVVWLILSFVVTLVRGTRVRAGGQLRSLLWLATILLGGDLWALLTFGIVREVEILTLITFLIGWWWIRRLRDWNALGQTLWVTSLLASVLYMAYSFGVTAFTPSHPLAFTIALALTFVEMAALALALTYVFESLDVCCRIRWRHQYEPMRPVAGYAPKVSLHVPAYNEPPEVVAATLQSLAQLDYPNYEVLLVDNNTPSEGTWRPLEKVCQSLGLHFRFLHLDKWPGYKSGALNFALTQTAPDAEIIGIIDADYLVSPSFLRDIVPFFATPEVAFVQTPQDYRDYEGNPYLEACHYAYKYFFAVSMPSRNERNAIIFAGTMGLIRRSVLQEIGGWDEWCITEDAEASLRVLKRGYQSVYVNRAYGTGLMPYTFDGLKKQRFRWCFGGIQILKKHWEALVPWARWLDPDNQLTPAQRYYYLAGGLQWFNEPLNLLFTLFLVIGAILHFSPAGGAIRVLTGPLVIVPVIFLATGMWRFMWVLRHALNLSSRDALRSMANFFSLGWTVTLACIQGLLQPAGVFMRTPKSKSTSGVVRAIRSTQWETAIGLICLIFAVSVNLYRPQWATVFLGLLLAWQASLYLSAPYYSLMSIRNQGRQAVVSRPEQRGPEVLESWIARWTALAALATLLAVGVSLLLPGPTSTPGYANLRPPDVSVGLIRDTTATPQPTQEVTATSTTVSTLVSTPTDNTTPALTQTLIIATTVAPTPVSPTTAAPTILPSSTSVTLITPTAVPQQPTTVPTQVLPAPTQTAQAPTQPPPPSPQPQQPTTVPTQVLPAPTQPPPPSPQPQQAPTPTP